MRNIFLIARREYLERVRTRSFIIMTFFIPALMLGVTVLPSLLTVKMMSKSSKRIAVVVSDAQMGSAIQQALESKSDEEQSQKGGDIGDAGSGLGKMDVQVETNTSAAERARLMQKVRDKQLDGVIWAPDDAVNSGKVDYIAGGGSGFISNSAIEKRVSQGISRGLLEKRGLEDAAISKVLNPVKLNEVDPTGQPGASAAARFAAAYILAFTLYFVMVIYGMNVMRAVLEEKTSRIMEVMLATARPYEMMGGKILGVASVGLTQIAIWVATSLVFSTPGLIATAGTLKDIGAKVRTALSPEVLIFFGVFFLLGYFLYSAMFAAVGSMVNSEQEAQQLQFIVTLPLIATVVILFSVTQQPNSSLAIGASLFPFTSPLIMFTRIVMQQAKPLEIAISLALLVATTVGLVWLCGRIYRIGILMYGKKPTLPEIVKWIKYA